MKKKYKDIFPKLPDSDQPIINITLEDMVIESDLLPFKKIVVNKKSK